MVHDTRTRRLLNTRSTYCLCSVASYNYVMVSHGTTSPISGLLFNLPQIRLSWNCLAGDGLTNLWPASKPAQIQWLTGLGDVCALVMGDSLRTKTIRFDSIQCHKRFSLIRFDSVQPTSCYLINSLIFVKPVNDNVYVSISLFAYRHLT